MTLAAKGHFPCGEVRELSGGLSEGLKSFPVNMYFGSTAYTPSSHKTHNCIRSSCLLTYLLLLSRSYALFELRFIRVAIDMQSAGVMYPQCHVISMTLTNSSKKLPRVSNLTLAACNRIVLLIHSLLVPRNHHGSMESCTPCNNPLMTLRRCTCSSLLPPSLIVGRP